MAINEKPITDTITKAHIGREITYQCAGMGYPEYGVISNPSRTEGSVFAQLCQRESNQLVDLYNCRWGHVGPWLIKNT